MSIAELADRIRRARLAATRPTVVDPYVRGLAALADLAAERLDAEDAWQRAGDDIESSAATARLAIADKALRAAVDLHKVRPSPVRLAERSGWLARLSAWWSGSW